MRKHILIITVCFLCYSLLIAQSPELTINGKTNEGVYLQALKIDVTVCGTIATTSWQMTFKNTTNKILEGNLNFPLKEGLSVSRYALDINGKMREAVPVDRAKGTATFEAIERRRVDPGLLEKLDGNVFRTRIYPIPANGSRTIIIGYNEELQIGASNTLQYKLPLNLKDTVTIFSINVSVIQSLTQPVFNTATNENIHFDKEQNNYKASFSKQNYVPNLPLSFTIPKTADAAEVMLQPFENKYCFLINTTVQKNEIEKPMPKTIALIWDESLSGAGRDTKKEIAILEDYFKKVNNATIIFQRFSNKASSIKKYFLQNGQWSNLKKDINSIVYDGGTNFGNLNLKSIVADEFILVSDGHQTIGNGTIQCKNTPVYCINSSTTADYSFLHFLTLKTGGQLIDLIKDDSIVALKKLTTEPYRFLGIKYRNGIEENYPSLPVPVMQNFSVAGIMEEDIEEVILQFGYGNKVTYEKSIKINAEDNLCKDFDISKIYAQKKIAELDINYEKNKATIESTGKQFGIVTRNTSLIVLETLNDYLQYEIQPPAEFREEYQLIRKQRQSSLITKKVDDFDKSLEMINELKEWYGKAKKEKSIVIAPTPIAEQPQTIRQQTPTPVNRTGSGVDRVITGRVVDKAGRELAFATIRIKGTNLGVQSDANGQFSIRVKNNDIVQASALGFLGNEIRINNNTQIKVSLEKSNNEMREVVVVGALNRRVNAKSVGTVVTTISTDELTPIPQLNVQNGLTGKVAGVNVQSTNNGVFGNTRVTLRGIRSLSNDGQNLEVAVGYSSTLNNDAEIDTDDTIQTNKINDSISILYNTLAPDYLTLIKKTNKQNRYSKYLEIRNYFMKTPTYFFDVAGYFLKAGEKEIGLKILSNLAEMENANYELYKMLGYKLKEAGDYDAEVSAFKKVLELRPLEPQSYRDYALALEDNGQYQQALDILYEGMTKSYNTEMNRMYDGIEEIFLVEINRLIQLHKKQVNTKNIIKELITDLNSDVRIVLNWNKNNTDIDLWVTDPNGEKCSYQNKTTAIGGRMSDDFTEGFGPEQFILKKGVKGKYKIQMDYFSDAQVTIAGPTTIMAEIYLYYGTPKEERKIITLQMKKNTEDEVYIGEVVL